MGPGGTFSKRTVRVRRCAVGYVSHGRRTAPQALEEKDYRLEKSKGMLNDT